MSTHAKSTRLSRTRRMRRYVHVLRYGPCAHRGHTFVDIGNGLLTCDRCPLTVCADTVIPIIRSTGATPA